MSLLFPVDQPYKITTLYSPTVHPGIDIAPLPAGTRGVECHAPESGSVVISAYRQSPEGNYVILRGDSGMYYYFGHFDKRLVNTLQRVSRGQAIGTLGMTGQATGIHTHHEVRYQAGPGRTVDPMQFYKEKEQEEMLEAPEHATLFHAYLGRPPLPEEVRRDVGKKSYKTMIGELDRSEEYKDKQKRDRAAYKALEGFEPVTEQLFKPKG